jgi:ribose transport system substrate-binding protein
MMRKAKAMKGKVRAGRRSGVWGVGCCAVSALALAVAPISITGATASAQGREASLASVVAKAKQVVAAATARNVPWTGPASGPKAVPGKTIALVVEDPTNTGETAVERGILQAGRSLGGKCASLAGRALLVGRRLLSTLPSRTSPARS